MKINMRNQYIKPESFCFAMESMNIMAESDPEPEISGDVGAKENGGFFDGDPFGDLWEDEPVEDPFSIDDY